MSQRREFVELTQAEGTNKRGLCRRFGISPTTGYKWFGRFREGSEAGLVELPRRPHYSPARTPSQVEQAVLSARAAHPAWGARKLRRWLLDRRDVFEADMPAPSTITAILRRHGRIDPAEGPKHRSWQRFEHQAPNDLWRDIYNLERPHDALDLATPATKYQVSQRLFPEVLPPLEYEPTDLVRRVHDKGRLQFFGRIFKVPKAFKGLPVAIRPTTDDGVWTVFFATHQIAQLHLRHDA